MQSQGSKSSEKCSSSRKYYSLKASAVFLLFLLRRALHTVCLQNILHCPGMSTFMMPSKEIISSNQERAVKSLFWLLQNPLKVTVGCFLAWFYSRFFSVKSQGFRKATRVSVSLCGSLDLAAVSFGI